MKKTVYQIFRKKICGLKISSDNELTQAIRTVMSGYVPFSKLGINNTMDMMQYAQKRGAINRECI